MYSNYINKYINKYIRIILMNTTVHISRYFKRKLSI